jgi:hypothetical protein
MKICSEEKIIFFYLKTLKSQKLLFVAIYPLIFKIPPQFPGRKSGVGSKILGD